MNNGFKSEHWTDVKGNPAGGNTYGDGFAIGWQNGPLKVFGCERKKPNGAFVDNIIKAVLDRLEFYQTTKFECNSNSDAIDHLKAALQCLEDRSSDRIERSVEGTHKV